MFINILSAVCRIPTNTRWHPRLQCDIDLLLWQLAFRLSSPLFFTSFHSPPSFRSIFSPSVFSSFCKLLSLTSVDSSCFAIASSHSELRLSPRLLSFPLHAHGLWRTLVFYSELLPTAWSFSVFTWSLREMLPTQCESIMSKSWYVSLSLCSHCVSFKSHNWFIWNGTLGVLQ